MSSVPMLGLLGLRQQGSQSNASNAAAVAAASTAASAASAGKSPNAKVSWLPSLARQPTSDGTLETGDGNDVVGKGAASAQVPTTVPTPRVAEPLPVLLGRTRFNPQRTRNAESEACAQAAREAFLERQARRASRVTGWVVRASLHWLVVARVFHGIASRVILLGRLQLMYRKLFAAVLSSTGWLPCLEITALAVICWCLWAHYTAHSIWVTACVQKTCWNFANKDILLSF